MCPHPFVPHPCEPLSGRISCLCTALHLPHECCLWRRHKALAGTHPEPRVSQQHKPGLEGGTVVPGPLSGPEPEQYPPKWHSQSPPGMEQKLGCLGREGSSIFSSIIERQGCLHKLQQICTALTPQTWIPQIIPSFRGPITKHIASHLSCSLPHNKHREGMGKQGGWEPSSRACPGPRCKAGTKPRQLSPPGRVTSVSLAQRENKTLWGSVLPQASLCLHPGNSDRHWQRAAAPAHVGFIVCSGWESQHLEGGRGRELLRERGDALGCRSSALPTAELCTCAGLRTRMEVWQQGSCPSWNQPCLQEGRGNRGAGSAREAGPLLPMGTGRM